MIIENLMYIFLHQSNTEQNITKIIKYLKNVTNTVNLIYIFTLIKYVNKTSQLVLSQTF
jgi:hypothetical protein